MAKAGLNDPVLSVDIPGLGNKTSGKVRDVFDLGNTLLLVASDRISAFDVIMPNGIPDKGWVLTQLARHWFRTLRPLTVNHYLTCDDAYIAHAIEDAGGKLSDSLVASLRGRSTLGVKAKPYPIECVVRGYIAGSLWKEYLQAGGPAASVTLHGYRFPAGLQECDRLPQPIFTPATKAESGHDENISKALTAEIVGREITEALEQTSLALYTAAAERASASGVIIADTKFEFGDHRGVLTLIDEALTPDSSRFWDAGMWQPGHSQPSYDKQFVRDWLESSGWNKEPPAPLLPEEIVQGTRAKYLEAFQRITGVLLD